MKYVNQLDYPDLLYVTRYEKEDPAEREKGKTTTIKSSGCGLCSAVMVADRLIPECKFELKDALKLSYDSEANHLVGTDFKRFAPAFAEKLGFDLEMTNDTERLRYCLRTGGAAVVHVRSGERNVDENDKYIGVFTHGGHYIAAISEERDGRIAVLDPSYKDGKYDEEGRKGQVEVKFDMVALCDIQVLANETARSTPGFYLFWRK